MFKVLAVFPSGRSLLRLFLRRVGGGFVSAGVVGGVWQMFCVSDTSSRGVSISGTGGLRVLEISW